MELFISNEVNPVDKDCVINKLIVFNHQHFPDDLKQLLIKAERLAKENECDFIKLDTLSFQALDFYKKQGYEVWGAIPNAGRHTHYYLKKDIIY